MRRGSLFYRARVRRTGSTCPLLWFHERAKVARVLRASSCASSRILGGMANFERAKVSYTFFKREEHPSDMALDPNSSSGKPSFGGNSYQGRKVAQFEGVGPLVACRWYLAFACLGNCASRPDNLSPVKHFRHAAAQWQAAQTLPPFPVLRAKFHSWVRLYALCR
jgi:hypothetical protein